MAARHTMASWEEPPLPRSFDSVFYGAAGGGEDLPSDDQFNRVSFLSHFDGANNGVNNAFDDGSTSNHTITANGNVTQGSFGPFARPDGEWSVSFDGDDYLSVAETGADEFTFGTGNFTIEGWINNQAVDGSRTIVSTAQGNDFQGIWFGIHESKYYYIYNNSGGWSVIVHAGTPVVNAWTHFAVVRNGTSNVVYINGSSIGSTTETARDLTNTNNLLAIGGRATASQYTISTMSNVRVVKGTAVYTGNFTPSTSKLTAITNTKLLTCQSNRFVDNSASPLTITPVGNPAVTAFGPFLTSSVYDPAVNGASLFNFAASDYLSFGNIGLDGHSGDFSIEGWIYPTAFVASSNPLYTQGSDGGVSDLLEISLNSSGQPHAFINQGSITLQSTFVCPLNAWTFLQLKRTSGTLAIFTNGVQSSTVSNTATISSPNRGFVGAQSYDTSHADRSFYGFICDVRVSVVTRSVSLPTAPLAVIDSNTKLLLNMADGQAIDQVAKSNIVLEGNAVTSTTQKKIGTASFYSPGGDGDKGLINTAGGALLPPYNWTIEVWTYCTNSAANQVVFAQGLSGGAGRVALGIEGSVYLLQIGTAKPQHNARTLNQWVHLCATYDGTTAKLYIDGTLASSGSVSYTTATDQNLQAGIGNLGTGWDTSAYGKWYGYIDELRVSRFIRHTGNFSPNTEAFPDKGQ
jgi:hypothetical protein